MALQQTVTVTEDIKIAPKLAKKLTTELQTYAKLKAQHKALEVQLEAAKGAIQVIQEELGVDSLEHEGFKVTLVAGTHQKFNEKRFIALGGEISIYNQANETKPSKPYVLVTVPKTEG